MTILQPFVWSLTAAFVLLVFEIITGTFVLMSLAAGLLAVAAVEACSGAVHPVLDTVVFLTLASGSIVVTRLAFRHSEDTKTTRRDINDY